MKYIATVLIAVLLVPQTVFSAVAFPGAEGFGTDTRGAYSGSATPTIYVVDNLNDSGTGSFRAAAEASGPRIVVFKTGGVLVSESFIDIEDPYITIAGQTAPGDGFTILGTKGHLRVRSTDSSTVHDVIVRGIRLRGTHIPALAYQDVTSCDVFEVTGTPSTLANDPYNIVFDHISASWSGDEIFNLWYGVQDITVSHSLFFQPLKTPERPAHNYGPIIGPGSERISYHHNVYSSGYFRSPLVGGTNAVHPEATDIEVINNVVYNDRAYGGFSIAKNTSHSPNTPMLVSFKNNYHKAGPETTADADWANGYSLFIDSPPTGSEVFAVGSLTPERTSLSDTEADAWNGAFSTYAVATDPFTPSGITETDAETNYNNLVVTNNGMDGSVPLVGAYPRDIVDTIAIEEIQSGSDFIGTVGEWTFGPLDYSYTSDWRNNRNKIPSYSTGTAWADTDEDGMDDAFEVAYLGGTSALPHDDHDGDGYTNIEEWFNSILDPDYGSGSTTYTLTITDTSTGTGDGTITSSPAGIDCGSGCSASFAEDTVVTLSYVPNTGDEFANWTGDCAGSGATCTLTMDQAHSASAVFNTAASAGNISSVTGFTLTGGAIQ